MQKPNPTALVTGASSGIGLVFAKCLAEKGYDLVITARRNERLEKLRAEILAKASTSGRGNVQIHIIACDLESFNERSGLLAELERRSIDIDLVINNAGFGAYGHMDELDLETQLRMVELNCKALAHFSHFFLAKMRQRGTGSIINVSSTASFQPLPFMSVYGATKAFVTSLTLALAAEVEGSAVRILTCCPGPTESDFHLAAGLSTKLSHLPAMPAESVVEQALAALGRKQTLAIHGWLNRLLVLGRHLPLQLQGRLVARVLKKNL